MSTPKQPQPLDAIPQVAILVSTKFDWGRRILKGILAYANEVGPWHVWVNSDHTGSLKSCPADWRGDGIIANVDNSALAQEIAKSGLPAVSVGDAPIKNFAAPCIRTDDRIGTQLAADHFMDRGLTNIAFVGPVGRKNPEWYGNAFKEYLERYSIPCLRFPIHENERNLNKRLSQWLLELPKPCGILTWGFDYGRAIVDSCMTAKISVPHDISVLSGSYDDLFSHACFPALSGVLAPTEQIGYAAAQKLHQMMQGEHVPNEVTYIAPRAIVERLSTDTLAVNDSQLIQVVGFIRENAFNPITMNDILKEVPMARRSLERHFHQAFGRSPIEEIRRIRIDKARKLLAETDLPMQEIAEACGYTTYNYLTHVFKQVTKQTPRDFRKQFRS